MPMIETESYAAFCGHRNGKADGLAGDTVAPCMPAACGLYVTFGWTALALAPHMFGIFLRSGSPGTAQGAVLNIIENIIAVIIVTFVARRASWPARDYLGLSSRPRAGAAIIAVAGQLALYLVLAITWWSAGFAVTPRIATVKAMGLADDTFWSWAFALVIVGPISEEIVFRGFMFRGLAQSRMGPVVAILTTSLVFSFLHFESFLHLQGSLMWHFACGFFYGCLRWRSGATWAPIIAHVFNNAVALAFATLIIVG
jgi:membrane protease YdiL (CAAX protease family)